MVKCQIMVSIKCHLHKRTQVDKGFFLGMVFASLQGYKARQRGQLDMDREIDTSMITEEQMIQIRRNAEEDIKLEELTKVRRKQASKRRKAYRSIDAEVADAIGLTKYRVNGKVYWE